MSFMNFTLYPDGGAFMLCESLSEFDPNVEDQKMSDVEALPNDELQKQFVADTKGCQDFVELLLRQMKDTYNNTVVPLSNLQLSEQLDSDIASNAEMIRTAATTIADCIQLSSATIHALQWYMNSDRAIDTTMSGLDQIAGIYMKRKADIIRDGYDSVKVVSRGHPFFSYSSIQVAKKLMDMKDVLKSGILLSNQIDVINSDSSFQTYFTSITDMLDAVFNHYDKLVRQENTHVHTCTISDYFKYKSDHPICDQSPCNGPEECNFMKFLSHVVRKTKQKMYQIQCELADRESGDIMYYNKCMYHSASMLYNIFALGVMMLLPMAYDINNFISEKESVDQHVEEILKLYSK